MKRIIFTVLFAMLVLCALAEAPRLTRNQLRQVATAKNQVVSPSSSADEKNKQVTLQQVMKERNLTLNDNRLISKAPSRQSAVVLDGIRIASMDVYDFEWDETNGIAYVIDSSYAISAQKCMIKSPEQGESPVLDRFDLSVHDDLMLSFGIPFDYDSITGVVTIKSGVALEQKTTSNNDSNGGLYPPAKAQEISNKSTEFTVVWTLYAMPLPWLTGNDDYDDIHGQVCDDGSIAFTDDFAFLVKSEWYTQGKSVKTSWVISPIYKNFTLFAPNAVHSYQKMYNNAQLIEPEYSGCGHGGISPRPINPRPGATKPVKPRAFDSYIEEGPGRGADAGVGHPSVEVSRAEPGWCPPGDGPLLYDMEHVYMYMLDDTTYMVYNLYGMDYSWNYMYVYPDNSVSFPAQPIADSENGFILYNCSMSTNSLQTDSLQWGNTGVCVIDSLHHHLSTISWSNTYLCNEFGHARNEYYGRNTLFYGINLYSHSSAPEFNEPVVTDSAVVFSATSIDSVGVACLYVYDVDLDDYVMVDNPWSAQRGDEAYWVDLMAETYYEDSGKYSGFVFMAYEVPALEQLFLRGDMNGDGIVNISDVTALIYYVLGGNVEGINAVRADLNHDDTSNISDVTILISFVLTNRWPENTR